MRVLVLLLLLLTSATAQDPQPKMVVGIKLAPPFVIRTPDGDWEGISVELWKRIAGRLGREFEWREFALDQLLEAVSKGEVDVAIGALTVTASREERFDFTHSFYNAGLAIAVPGETVHSSYWRALTSWRFLKSVGGLLVILSVVGVLVWFLERRRNAEQFGSGRFLTGIGQGFWWSAVTMTTVGYGDCTPRTPLGRTVAVVWMFTSVIVIATFTGAIASALTVEQLESGLAGPEDLPGHRVAALASSTGADYLRREGIVTVTAPDTDALIGLLRDGEAEAIVHDAPLLLHLARSAGGGTLEVLPRQFERQDYAFALPPGSALRESVNRALLEVTGSREWPDVLRRYLGR